MTKTKRPGHNEPHSIIPREHHTVSRKNISTNALKVLRRLREAGHNAFLVGGGVRDLLLGGHPKDFDVATSATPEQVAELFTNCILIGRRFRLAHIRYGDEVIEVATFRGHPKGEETEAVHDKTSEGMILRDNVYGTLEEDAWRRDFTINALYYDLDQLSIIDYTGGMADLKTRTLRIIGEPEQRFREDPVRMLRAIRFMNKLDFSLTEDVATLIPQMASLLEDIPAARLFEEFIKLFMHGHAQRAYHLLEKYGVFYKLFPYLYPVLNNAPTAEYYRRFIEKAFENTDIRIAQNKPVTPAFLLAVLLWPLYQIHLQHLLTTEKATPTMTQRQSAIEHALSQHRHYMALPRRFSAMIYDVWELQPRLEKPRVKQIPAVLTALRFRAAYDFLLLRMQTGDEKATMADWWTKLQVADEKEKKVLLAQIDKSRKKKKRRRKSSHTTKDENKEK